MKHHLPFWQIIILSLAIEWVVAAWIYLIAFVAAKGWKDGSK